MLNRRSEEKDSQQTLRVQLTRNITGRLGGAIRDLQVDVSGERVILQGRAKTYYAKQLAQEASRTVQEFAQLVNEIIVDSSSAAGLPHRKRTLESS